MAGLGQNRGGTRFTDEKEPWGKKNTSSSPTEAGSPTVKKHFVVQQELFKRLQRYVAHQTIDQGKGDTNNSTVVCKSLDAFLTEKGF